MKKIMFNDRYGLTQAVLNGRKTMTRRIVPKILHCGNVDFTVNPPMFEDCNGDWHTILETSYAYKVGEIVAIAQAYADVGFGDTAPIIGMDENDMPIIASDAGLYNKMFVRADLMPHQIRITNVRVERLQDISDEDCIKEGIRKWTKDYEIFKYDMSEGFEIFKWIDKPRTPRRAYAALIDKVSGKGTWKSNPYVFAYEFELVK